MYRAHENFYLVLGNIWQHEWAEYCAEVDCCPDVFFWFFLFLIWLFVSTRSQENKQPLPVFHDRAWEGQKKRVQICKWKQINDSGTGDWWLVTTVLTVKFAIHFLSSTLLLCFFYATIFKLNSYIIPAVLCVLLSTKNIFTFWQVNCCWTKFLWKQCWQ